jgi:hypothetical protein
VNKTKQSEMSDDQIQEYIYHEIKMRGITFNDMIGGTGAVDPGPDGQETGIRERLRGNKFLTLAEDTRMMELLAAITYSELVNLQPQKISLQDLFRFWWNRCVEKTLVVEMVLEDIFTHFREEMRPPVEEMPQLDMSVDFEQLLVSNNKKVKAA